MTAEREAKALENVRDRLRIMADVYSEHAFADNLLSLASDIDAHLSRAAEPVGVAYVERLKAGYPTTAFPPSHPNAADMGNLYTHPPEPARDAKDLLRRLRGCFQQINDDTGGDNYLNLSCDGLGMIDAAMAQESGDGK